jgi:hypothetical protein
MHNINFLPTHEFHSLLQKMNIEYLKYLMMLCLGKNKMQMNHFTHSLLKVLEQVKLSHQCFQFKVYYFLQQASLIKYV